VTGSRTIIVAVVAVVIATAALWFLALAPKAEESARLQGEIDTTQAAVAESRAQLADLKTARSAYATNYASVARLGKAVPADDDVRSLIVQLDSAARRSGVDFHSIELTGASAAAPVPGAAADASQSAAATLPPGATVGTAGLPTMPFTFEFDGTFFSLSTFFARLERFVKTNGDQVDVTGRMLAIDGFSLTPGEDGFPSVKASIGATAYLVPKEQGTMGGGTPEGPTAGVAQPASATTPGAPASSPGPAPPSATSTGAIR
jgi:hypothetical protein